MLKIGGLSTPSTTGVEQLLPINYLKYSRLMSDGNSSNQSCGGKKKAMMAYGVIQISATVVSAIAQAAKQSV